MKKTITSIPLIFVWLGGDIPHWAIKSLKLTRKNNSDLLIIILHNNIQNNKYMNIFRKMNILLKQVDYEYKNSNIINSKHLIKGDFWKFTSLRFEALNNYIIANNIKNFYHAEIDNIVFNLGKLDKYLNSIGNGVFVPRDSFDRAIGSFLYCNKPSCFREILNLYSEPYKVNNDMEALGIYARNSKNFFSLPTESYKQNSNSWDLIDPNDIGGLFDAAAIGQYILGIDPRNNRFKPTYNLFKNENANINFEKLELSTNGIDIFLKTELDKKLFKIYNLHVHSKNIDRAKDFLEKRYIYKSVFTKKRIIVSNYYKIIIGKPHQVVLFILKNIKKLIKSFFNAIIFKN